MAVKNARSPSGFAPERSPTPAFLFLIPALGMRDALVTTLLVQLVGVALTGLLSLRLPRTVG